MFCTFHAIYARLSLLKEKRPSLTFESVIRRCSYKSIRPAPSLKLYKCHPLLPKTIRIILFTFLFVICCVILYISLHGLNDQFNGSKLVSLIHCTVFTVFRGIVHWLMYTALCLNLSRLMKPF